MKHGPVEEFKPKERHDGMHILRTIRCNFRILPNSLVELIDEKRGDKEDEEDDGVEEHATIHVHLDGT